MHFKKEKPLFLGTLVLMFNLSACYYDDVSYAVPKVQYYHGSGHYSDGNREHIGIRNVKPGYLYNARSNRKLGISPKSITAARSFPDEQPERTMGESVNDGILQGLERDFYTQKISNLLGFGDKYTPILLESSEVRVNGSKGIIFLIARPKKNYSQEYSPRYSLDEHLSYLDRNPQVAMRHYQVMREEAPLLKHKAFKLVKQRENMEARPFSFMLQSMLDYKYLMVGDAGEIDAVSQDKCLMNQDSCLFFWAKEDTDPLRIQMHDFVPAHRRMRYDE
ncbi:hypothetical protein NEFER03_2032 [Nematocida sp. LUAm3]|nr:hypothetical protein NEFER03_2032 [Nematocida sp. LUAm3]KAI5174506.1 hypothetical protein NEFER02_0627 [Nematocida sp. LUAm2]KAI5179157.1 hypothetical protein NEFER01_2020 [Nematocida sp. LUAm1]